MELEEAHILSPVLVKKNRQADSYLKEGISVYGPNTLYKAD
mgnify:CR=1 FL=1